MDVSDQQTTPDPTDEDAALLHKLGCYVDLTFPSAPDPCQPD